MPTPPTPLPLTRAANLLDFDGVCPSVAAWQQQHAQTAWARWHEDPHRPSLDRSRHRLAVVNWGAASFRAPHTRFICDYYDLSTAPGLADRSHGAIFALSVLDRIERPSRILRQCVQALVPGGLLVATVALWNATGPDCAVGHELRSRIYDRHTWKNLLDDARGLGLKPYGGVDLRYPGDALGDHTLAAIVWTTAQPD